VGCAIILVNAETRQQDEGYEYPKQDNPTQLIQVFNDHLWTTTRPTYAWE
jgi:hypothetical protein